MTKLEKAIERFKRRVVEPDNVCEAEYRAVHNLLTDQLMHGDLNEDEDPTKHLIGMLDQVISSAKAIKKRLRRKTK